MAKIETFEKILNLRDREKKQAHKIYQDAINQFEKVANKMYNLLRQKEKAELAFEEKLKSPVPVNHISQHHQYIRNLEQEIANMQHMVQQARTTMEDKQQDLTNAFIEVKKFEKLIENKKKKILLSEIATDKKFMDEISVQNFINNRS